MTETIEYEVLEERVSDGRAAVSLVQTANGRALMKSVSVADPQSFDLKVAGLAAVQHESLVPILAHGYGGVDGTAFVMVDATDAPTLQETGDTDPEYMVQLGLEVARALASVHKAGALAGYFTPADIYVTAPAMLDVSLAPLAEHSTAAAEVENLVQILLARAPYHNDLRAAIEGVTDADLLIDRLDSIHINAGTVSGVETIPEELGAGERLVGMTLGNWTLQRLLGEGAMGWVFTAVNKNIGRTAAVKVLKSEHSANTDLVQRFMQEAQAVNAIKNEHIVEALDFNVLTIEGGTKFVYCVMELLKGSSLTDRLRRAPLSVASAAAISSQIARALGAAHAVGVIHRDVKPDNIFLTRRGETDEYVKVLDFGVAKLQKTFGDLPKNETVAGIVVGTPDYMAPEQALGQSVDLRCDLYALGLVLYEMLAGRKPFHADSFGQLVVLITTSEPPPLPELTPGGERIPPQLADVVMKAINKAPEGRFQSGTEFADALDTYITRPVVKRPKPQGTAQKNRRGLVIGLGLGAIAIGGAAMFGYARLNQPKPTPVVVEPTTAPAPPPSPVTITLDASSSPSGAKVTRTDTKEVLGTTPFKLSFPKSGNVTLEFSLDDYASESRLVNLAQDVLIEVSLSPKTVRAGANQKRSSATRSSGQKGSGSDGADTTKRPATKKQNVDSTVDPFNGN